MGDTCLPIGGGFSNQSLSPILCIRDKCCSWVNPFNFLCCELRVIGSNLLLGPFFLFSDFVILQAPPSVYEGDSIHLRCHTYPGNAKEIRGVTFYKDDKVLQSSLKNSDLRINSVSMNDTGRYKCEKKFYYTPAEMYSDETFISVNELFSFPRVTVTMNPKTEGDPMTLTCDTSLSPHSWGTKLEFSFFKDGQSIQEFGSSNMFVAQYARLEDSGNYTCEVRSSTSSVWKRSNMIYIQIYSRKQNGQVHRDYTNSNIMRLILSGIIFIIGAIISCHHWKSQDAP
ncbi:Fc receptor-like protein 5 [Rhinoderma darwinii]|uniref:Fc receptor-like protein 5 n=1 Tax=Rhinoderma darwinii TaxID=43563 RepID=UPI003F66E784